MKRNRKMEKFLSQLGISQLKVPALPISSVPDWAWLLAGVFILGIVVGVALFRHSRVRFAEKHLRHKLRNDKFKAIHGDADTGKVLVVHDSGETEIPNKPYKDGKLPARGFEGFRPKEIARAAARIGDEPHVVRSYWKTKKRGKDNWKVEPMAASPVMTEQPQRPSSNKDRPKQASTATASEGKRQDERSDRGQRPNQPPAPEQPASTAIN